MINRSTIKYSLKKRLPKNLFSVVLFLWQKILLHVVNIVDKIRIRKFTTYHPVQLQHRKSVFSLFISPKNGFIDKHIFLYGVYEPFILDLIALYIKPGMTFIDIGANIGQHSMYAATLVGERGSVHSFEPIKHIYKQLEDSVRVNHFEKIIHAHNIALGNHTGAENLHVSENIGGSSLVHDDSTQEVVSVTVKPGDQILFNLQTVDVVKIDVEGYEFEVLDGLRETIKKYKPVMIIEYSGELYRNQRNNHGAKILSLIRMYNYTLFDIENDMHKVLDDMLFDTTISTKRKQTNLLCIPK